MSGLPHLYGMQLLTRIELLGVSTEMRSGIIHFIEDKLCH